MYAECLIYFKRNTICDNLKKKVGKFFLKENQTPPCPKKVHEILMPIDRGHSKTYIYKVLEKVTYPFFL